MKCPYCKGTGELVGEDATIAACIVSMRKSRGLTQKELADKSALSRGQLANIEVGRTDMPIGTLKRIADALECSMKDLMP